MLITGTVSCRVGALYKESIRQAVAGIVFEGVKKLPDMQRSPQMLLFEWIALSEQIKQQNKVVDRHVKYGAN